MCLPQELLKGNGISIKVSADDISAVIKKLRDEVEKNNALGQQLGIDNMQQLQAEKALLKRENDLLKAMEQGKEIGG